MKRWISFFGFAICLVAQSSYGQDSCVVQDGKQWLQPAEFLGYSYSEIEAVCPDGKCAGTLPGSSINLTGYTWASLDDVYSLFNSYGVTPPFESFETDQEWRTSQNEAAVALAKDFETYVAECTFDYYGPCLLGLARNGKAITAIDWGLFSTLPNFVDEDPHWSPITGVWFWRAIEESSYPLVEGRAVLCGDVETADGSDVCALVLASGQHTFSCDPPGRYWLANLPAESNGTIVRQIYANGFFPSVEVLEGSMSETVVLKPAIGCPNYNLVSGPLRMPGSAGKRHRISGRVLLQNTDTPVCALLLANGQRVFSCNDTGSFSLEFPLDDNGQYTLQTYAVGFAPSAMSFDEFGDPQQVRLARAPECIELPDTVVVAGREWLQPDQFLNYTWDEVSAVCPAGACLGKLPGSAINLTGYTWASIEDVVGLFNSYVDPPFTGFNQSRVHQDAGGPLISEEFRPTGSIYRQHNGEKTNLIEAMLHDRVPATPPGDFSFASAWPDGWCYIHDNRWADSYGVWFWKVAD